MKLSGSLTLFLLNLIILVCILIKVLKDSQDRVCLVVRACDFKLKNISVCTFLLHLTFSEDSVEICPRRRLSVREIYFVI